MKKRRSQDGRTPLDGQARLLLTVESLYTLANALSGIFLPVYLWKAGGSFATIGWYALAQTIATVLAFRLAGPWVKTGNKMNCLRAGLLLSCLFFGSVLLLGPQAAGFVIPLGALGGSAAGLFWLAFNVVYFEITEPDTRDRFNGWSGLLASASGIAAPWLSGVVISAMRGESGYRLVFTASLALFGCAAFGSLYLRRRRAGERYDRTYGLRQLRGSGSPWRRVVPALASQGIREGVFMFLLGLLVYVATREERSLGSFSLWTSLVALASFWIMGRRLSASRRRTAMLIGSVMTALSALPLFWSVSYPTLLILGIGTGLFLPMFGVPMTSAVYDLVGSSEESAARREELIVLRELAISAGRLLGLAAYLVLVTATRSQEALVWLLFAAGAAPVAGWWFMRRGPVGAAKPEGTGVWGRQPAVLGEDAEAGAPIEAPALARGEGKLWQKRSNRSRS